MSTLAASLVFNELETKPNSLLGASTGNSPKGLYKQLADRAKKDISLFAQLRIIKLDEWGGLSMDDPITCERYLQDNLLSYLSFNSDRYISFNSNPKKVALECKRIQSELEHNGAIDICVLGIGTNGHIGFNEPASYLKPHCHKAKLTAASLEHQMIQSAKVKPKYGLTLGMKDIMMSGKIILLVSGEGKERVTKKLLTQKISSRLPASFLWLHNQVECLINQNMQ